MKRIAFVAAVLALTACGAKEEAPAADTAAAAAAPAPAPAPAMDSAAATDTTKKDSTAAKADSAKPAEKK